MTENEIKEYVTEIRHKADIFRKSGFATAGFATHFDKSADIIEELLPYMAIGTIDEFKTLKEKSEPKKAIGKREYNEAYCPCCNEVISDGEFWALDEYVHHCNECGQAVKGVDWQ